MEMMGAATRAVGLPEESDSKLHRLLFIGTVIVAGMLFWIAPRPGMGDLPQHAGQVALLHDLITGTSPWTDLVRINYFTPYLLGYGVALALSFVMPVLIALKLCLTLAFYAFVAAGVALRKEFKADARLDWLYVPGFFGFACQYGFYTYLLAVPLGLFFLILAKRFAEAPTVTRALAVLAGGALLFFSHGLVFAFSCAIGAAFLPLYIKRPLRLASAALPYACLGMLIIAYLLYVRHHALVASEGPAQTTPATLWDWTGAYGWHRSYNFLLYTVATEMKDWFFLPGVLFMLAAPWLLRSKLNWREPAALIPMFVLLLIWLCVPSDALGTSYLYHRFAVFLLPAYALMFQGESSPRRAVSPAKAMLVQIALTVFCLSYLGVLAVREYRFAKENAPFETLLARTEPGQRAVELIFSPESEIIHNLWTYHSYALWYQSEHQGFVDVNFAYFLPQIVRFRPDRIPAMHPGMKGFSPETFDWHAIDGRIYRYIFVRHTQPLPPHMFDNSECKVVLLDTVPGWSLFEQRTCH
jgi:hypothetical protein